MNADPSTVGKGAESHRGRDPAPGEARPPSERRAVLAPVANTASPLRWLIVMVPLLVIAMAGSNLLGVWSTPAQQALREARQRERAHDAESEAERVAGAEREAAAGAAEERPSERGPSNPGIEDYLRKYFPEAFGNGAERDRPAATTDPRANPLPGPGTARLEDRPAAPPEIVDPALVVRLMRSADPEAGARIFKTCATCHAAAEGAPAKIGPNLWGIVGRPMAAQSSFRYSQALKSLGGQWTYEDLAGYLQSPRTYAPGTSMAFAGIKNPQRVASLIAYLRTLADKPVPLPE